LRRCDGQGGWRRLIAAGSSLLFVFALGGAAAAQSAPKKVPQATKMRLATFQTSPFPFDGEIPEKGVRFLDAIEGERKGHTARGGNVYWQDKTYSDRRVLLALPRGFDPHKPILLVVFFHGNGATLERDVNARQQVTRQVLESGRNTVLVAPQFAVDAHDSSAGRFWEPGMFRAFLDEAAAELAQMAGGERHKAAFEKAPVVLVAYSGGYLPAAFSLQVGDVDDRVKGLIMLDALYGELDKFRAWMARKPDMFFVSVHTDFTSGVNQALQKLLRDDNVKYETTLPRRIEPGTVSFIPVSLRFKPPPAPEAKDGEKPSAEQKAEQKAAEQRARDKAAVDLHMGFVTNAFAADPLRLILARVPRSTEPAAPPVPVAATTARDPNYVARMPRPRPKSIVPNPAPEPDPDAPPPRLPTARED
jgi:hypothetical protein